MTAGERMHAAKAEAESIVEEGRQKRADLEKVIADLTERRDKLLDEIESIAGALTGTASQHRRPRARARDVRHRRAGGREHGDAPEAATAEVATAKQSGSGKSSAGKR